MLFIYVIKICLQSNQASVYLESRLSMQRLLWNERWARETAAFVYNFILFSSEILKILFVVVKETSLSYVEEVVAIMYLGWYSLAHLLSKSSTYSDILTLIKSMNFIGTSRVSPSQICISTQKDLVAKQEGMSLLKIPHDLTLFRLRESGKCPRRFQLSRTFLILK